ncbi:hypothetical protein EI94DRAFT_1704335 [Lactarius quietus]|nr:hypothetical protein EI94DRAFT_1704335 [Lactarius quietus]
MHKLTLLMHDALLALKAVPCTVASEGINKSQQAHSIMVVEYLMLDEADYILDKGSKNNICRIIGHTMQGAVCQTLMCYCQQQGFVDEQSHHTRNLSEIEVFDDECEKDQCLLMHLKKPVPKKKGSDQLAQILVFILYKKEAPWVESMLQRAGTLSPSWMTILGQLLALELGQQISSYTHWMEIRHLWLTKP